MSKNKHEENINNKKPTIAEYEEINDFFFFKHNIEIISQSPPTSLKKKKKEERNIYQKKLFQEFLQEIIKQNINISLESINRVLSSLKTRVTHLPNINEISTFYHNFLEKYFSMQIFKLNFIQ